jgi:hypothetical protein
MALRSMSDPGACRFFIRASPDRAGRGCDLMDSGQALMQMNV